MEYPLKSYELTSLATLEQFWWDMYEICTNTPLGISANVNGQEITVEVSLGPTPRLLSEPSRYQFWEICTRFAPTRRWASPPTSTDKRSLSR
jgi:hypothetical protein